ncbi:fluoride efflux transporter CrcB [Paludifilum halophilum]|uniref:Fluoride-specific ion channel FluC n=1 Tax=Paludifilum halophilum TaxID=1642702 RepID=A0A235BCV8_9BACL|nr:fluoride efflux transporter CrcB [Paludifilum halophilum]OYD09889.1 hypothetical protein CHM34_02625 [Paludifilum halophilum]
MNYLAVGVAGMVGALLRYAIGLLFLPDRPVHEVTFPFGTWIANGIGCFALGWFQTRVFSGLSSVWRTAIGTGLIGSFTTFSTFSVETVQLLQSGNPEMAAIYLLLSLWGGLFLAWAGGRIGRIQAKRAG